MNRVLAHDIKFIRDPKLLDDLSKSEQSYFVQIEVAANPNTSTKTLRNMLLIGKPYSIMSVIFRNSNVTYEEFFIYQDTKDIHIIRALFSAIKIPEYLIEKIIDNNRWIVTLEGDQFTRDLLKNHPNCPERYRMLFILEN